MIEMGKKYKTRDGRDVRTLCTDGPIKDLPVVGFISGNFICWKITGKFYSPEHEHRLDLIEATPWDDFKIDEPVMVRDPGICGVWLRRYFAGVKAGKPTSWFGGCASWTVGTYGYETWDECRRPTKEELKCN